MHSFGANVLSLCQTFGTGLAKRIPSTQKWDHANFRTFGARSAWIPNVWPLRPHVWLPETAQLAPRDRTFVLELRDVPILRYGSRNSAKLLRHSAPGPLRRPTALRASGCAATLPPLRKTEPCAPSTSYNPAISLHFASSTILPLHSNTNPGLHQSDRLPPKCRFLTKMPGHPTSLHQNAGIP